MAFCKPVEVLTANLTSRRNLLDSHYASLAKLNKSIEEVLREISEYEKAIEVLNG